VAGLDSPRLAAILPPGRAVEHLGCRKPASCPNGIWLILPDRGVLHLAEQQTATCPRCSWMISPEDTIVFGYGLLGHLDCRRPRVLSAEERTLLFIYCRDHQVAECDHLDRE
jgi:hypothetical protein